MADNSVQAQIVGYLAIVVIVICLVFLGGRFTGKAVDTTAEVNVSIESTGSVTFVDESINFGYGQVTAGQSSAVINSWGAAQTNGNWSTLTDYLMLENVGNVNATVYITSGKNATSYLGGTGPAYKMNVTDNEGGSCNTTFQSSLGNLTELNKSAQTICAPLGFVAGNDTVNISIQLTIPADVIPGTKNDVLTATATAS